MVRLSLAVSLPLLVLAVAAGPVAGPALAAGADADTPNEATPPSEDEPLPQAKPREHLKGVPPATGLPVPRFVAMRAHEANLRTGPGRSYPVEWVFSRKGMPVEITAEFDTWRRIRDWEGSQGWVHQSMLTGKRTVMVRGDTAPLHREPSAESAVVAFAKPSVMGKLLKCRGVWCQVDMQGHKGWLTRSQVWGVYRDEKVE